MSAVSGLLLIDKPLAMTSHDVVDRVRRAFNTREVGHAGTLDPMASGLLVLLVGQATKLSDYLLAQDKSYQGRFSLGVVTDTWDLDGTVMAKRDVDLDPEQVRAAMMRLRGTLTLPVPTYSAVKVKGKKAVDEARAGRSVVIPDRPMTFHEVDVLDVGRDFGEFRISCAKGGYIRSWCHQLGEDLGVGAALVELRRVASLPYRLEQALPLTAVEKIMNEMGSDFVPQSAISRLGSAFVPMVEALPEWRTYYVREREAQMLKNGQIAFDLANRLICEQKTALRENRTVGIKVIRPETQQLLGLLEARPGHGLRIKRVFSA